MEYKYKSGDKVRIVDGPYFAGKFRDKWVGALVTLGTSSDSGVCGRMWTIEEQESVRFFESEMIVSDEVKRYVYRPGEHTPFRERNREKRMFTEGKEYLFRFSRSDLANVVDDLGVGNSFKQSQVEHFGFVPVTTTSPVRTETIKRTVIEPGVYGRLRVGHATVGNTVWLTFVSTVDGSPQQKVTLNSTELRELARIATELAEGLDAQ